MGQTGRLHKSKNCGRLNKWNQTGGRVWRFWELLHCFMNVCSDFWKLRVHNSSASYSLTSLHVLVYRSLFCWSLSLVAISPRHSSSCPPRRIPVRAGPTVRSLAVRGTSKAAIREISTATRPACALEMQSKGPSLAERCFAVFFHPVAKLLSTNCTIPQTSFLEFRTSGKDQCCNVYFTNVQ